MTGGLFLEFLDASGLPCPQVIQVEVTYVNHLVRGEDWNSYNDVAKFLKPIAPLKWGGRQWSPLHLSPRGCVISAPCRLQFGRDPMWDCKSMSNRLYDNLMARKFSNLCWLLRGAPKSTSDEALSDALDRCHDAVILGFDDVTTGTRT